MTEQTAPSEYVFQKLYHLNGVTALLFLNDNFGFYRLFVPNNGTYDRYPADNTGTPTGAPIGPMDVVHAFDSPILWMYTINQATVERENAQPQIDAFVKKLMSFGAIKV